MRYTIDCMFSRHPKSDQYAALIDIGSGSVTTTILYNRLNSSSLPEILWTHQERTYVSNPSQNTNAPILSALLNAFLALGSEGISALRSFDQQATISILQVSVSAPWSYTVTKQVTVQQERELIITQSFINDLAKAAEKEATFDISDNDIANELDLTITTRAILEVRANDYQLPTINKQQANTVSLHMASVVVQTYLLEALQQTRDKVLPEVPIHLFSTILEFYFILKGIHPEMYELCLVSVTLEATEIGVVRDGVLQFSTHAPIGILTVASEVANALSVPAAEVYGAMQGKTWEAYIHSTTKAQQEQVQTILDNYVSQISELLQQTGDDFTIPKSIYAHTAGYTFSTFGPLIDTGAEEASGLKHIVHDVHETLESKIKSHPANSTIQLLSAYFFHIYGNDARFTYL